MILTHSSIESVIRSEREHPNKERKWKRYVPKHHRMQGNGLDLLPLPEASALTTPQISETGILLKIIFSLQDEKKSRNKCFFLFRCNFEVRIALGLIGSCCVSFSSRLNLRMFKGRCLYGLK